MWEGGREGRREEGGREKIDSGGGRKGERECTESTRESEKLRGKAEMWVEGDCWKETKAGRHRRTRGLC